MLDSLPIFASLNFAAATCACCGKQRLKRAIEISSSELDPIYLGVTCCGEWFDCNLSGNPYKAVSRLNKKLRSLSNSDVEDIINQIKESE